MAKILRVIGTLVLFLSPLIPLQAFAHETYVLTKEQLQKGLRSENLHAFDALANPSNLQTFLLISFFILAVLIANFFFRRTAIATKISRTIERFHALGPVAVRLAIGASFFFSALTWSFLGPELSLDQFPLAILIRSLLFVLSGLLFVGLFTQIAALVSLILLGVGAYIYGWYLITYINYLGVVIVLVLFGSRRYSLDKLFFGTSRRFSWLNQYGATIIRVSYGLALIWAAISVKLLHPQLTMMVVKTYHLNNYHVLFPHDPLLITLGVSLAELLIGLFIMVGFELRFTILVSLFYITLSLLYFRESVWPHVLLYGISLELLVSPEIFSIDSFLDMRRQRSNKKR